MAGEGRPARRAWGVLAVALASTALASAVFLAVPGGSACTSGSYATYCPVGGGPIAYVTTNLSVPASGNVTDVGFAGVGFHLWSAYGGVQGTATEPGGLTLDFFVAMPGSIYAASVPALLPGATIWSSPDGNVNVLGLGSSEGLLDVQVQVASPIVLYASQTVTLETVNASRTAPATATLQGVDFSLIAGELVSSAGPFLYVNASEANGTTVVLHVWDGPLAVCTASTPETLDLIAEGFCLYAGAPQSGVGVLWNGGLSVTLLVREA